MACSKAVLSSMKEVYSCTGLFQETRKLSNKEYNLPSKKIRKDSTCIHNENSRENRNRIILS